MAYDLLIKNGRIVDGSGMPAYRGDLGIRNGKVAEIGKLRGAAARTIDADGLVVAPGFIDTHCHFDAQVTWDPLCTFSCYHGATTVINGNCSLTLAPVRPGTEERLFEYLSWAEAIPMETLKTVRTPWTTTAEYMDSIDQRLGINVGCMVGHTAVRHYVMGKESQGRAATAEEIEQMRELVHDGIAAGALGFSISQNRGMYDPQGELIPACWAQEDELFALGDVLAELGTGIIQAGGGRDAELKRRLMTRLSEATGRQVVYNNLVYTPQHPEQWQKQIDGVEEAMRAGIRANPMCTPLTKGNYFNMHNSQVFRGVPTWHPVLLAPDEEKLSAYRDPEFRAKVHREAVDWMFGPEGIPGNPVLGPHWYESIWIEKVKLAHNKPFEGKTVSELATATGKGIIDALLDLVVEEELDTEFAQPTTGGDKEVMRKLLNYPHAYLGLSDSGAHVQYRGGYGYSSQLLGHWVRREHIMSLEQAVKRLTFENASIFGITDRGLLRPGLAADIAIFDPDTIRSLPQDKVYDLPAGAWRMRELATGVHWTIVNGDVLLEEGRHTGALPGRVIRNTLYHEMHGA
jgi:N-acyl-D-aspartate/D-glutamate deacylase